LAEERIALLMEENNATIGKLLRELQKHYQQEHGLRVVRLAGGWQVVTAPEHHDIVEKLRSQAGEEKLRISKAALETLAVIAYNQPVTRSEIEEIRNVRCDRVVDTLLRFGLVRIAGRRKGTGNPFLYRTTDFFLEIFGINSITDLPTLEELQEEE
ncbi:MAG TPA: SMC-Scp complex subunit ScpB, partial [Synergistaceae bacterium]|nr:SMC-Scp complex subunit ScpB [Synergistaceae bacterium]